MIIWLKYRQKGAPIGTTSAMRFDALTAEGLDETEKNQQRGLTGRNYTHLLSSRVAFDVEIGADETIDATKKAFLDEFWIAAQQWISLDTSAIEPAAGLFVEVDTPAGRAPYQPIEGNWNFVTFRTILTAKEPN